MNKRQIKKQWLAALESGVYKQGHDVLYNPTHKSFCCLGVLQHCLLDGKVETFDGYAGDESDKVAFESFGDDRCASLYLPSRDFYEAFPQLEWVAKNQGDLAEMNDNGKDFSVIAAYIRKEWKV